MNTIYIKKYKGAPHGCRHSLARVLRKIHLSVKSTAYSSGTASLSRRPPNPACGDALARFDDARPGQALPRERRAPQPLYFLSGRLERSASWVRSSALGGRARAGAARETVAKMSK